MSQISVLGFTPTSSTSTLFSSSIHWAILISPDPTLSRNPQPTNSTVLDIHDHQLRQQPWPIPVEDEMEARCSTAVRPLRRQSPTPSSVLNFQTTSSRSASPAPSSTLTTASTTTTTTTLNATSQHPLRLSLKICIGTLAQRPSKLISRLHKLLQTTPTYGLEEDWLRSALVVMHEQLSMMDPGFDVDGFISYACEAAKEYLLYDATQDDGDDDDDEDHVVPEADHAQVLELDYLAHVRRNDQVKALLSQHPQSRRRVHHKSPYVRHRYQQSPPPRYSPSALTSDRDEATPTPAPQPPSWSLSSSPSLQSHGACHSFGGVRRWFETLRKFHVSPSPTQVKHRNPLHLQPWQRRDDPYGGLM